jgi:hypothetical protein
MNLYRDYLSKIELEYEPKQESVCVDVAQALRKYALDMAIRMANFEAQRADDMIEDAIKIENYLAGKLEAPNMVTLKCACPGTVECGQCEGVIRDDL